MTPVDKKKMHKPLLSYFCYICPSLKLLLTRMLWSKGFFGYSVGSVSSVRYCKSKSYQKHNG